MLSFANKLDRINPIKPQVDDGVPIVGDGVPIRFAIDAALLYVGKGAVRKVAADWSVAVGSCATTVDAGPAAVAATVAR